MLGTFQDRVSSTGYLELEEFLGDARLHNGKIFNLRTNKETHLRRETVPRTDNVLPLTQSR